MLYPVWGNRGCWSVEENHFGETNANTVDLQSILVFAFRIPEHVRGRWVHENKSSINMNCKLVQKKLFLKVRYWITNTIWKTLAAEQIIGRLRKMHLAKDFFGACLECNFFIANSFFTARICAKFNEKR